MPPRTNPDSDDDDDDHNYHFENSDDRNYSIGSTTTTTTTTLIDTTIHSLSIEDEEQDQQGVRTRTNNDRDCDRDNDDDDDDDYDYPPLPVIPPIPDIPSDDNNNNNGQEKQYTNFFTEWSNNIELWMKSYYIPCRIDQFISEETFSTYQSSIKAVVLAIQIQNDAEKVLEELQNSKHPSASPESIAAAKQVVQDAQINVQQTTLTCQKVAYDTILVPLGFDNDDNNNNNSNSNNDTTKTKKKKTSMFFSAKKKKKMKTSRGNNNNDDDDDDDYDDDYDGEENVFLLYIVLQKSNIPSLVSWCMSNITNAKQLIHFLITQYTSGTYNIYTPPTQYNIYYNIYIIMQGGYNGPNNQQYGRAIQIYYQIEQEETIYRTYDNHMKQQQQKEKNSSTDNKTNQIDTTTITTMEDEMQEKLLLQRLQIAIALEHAEPIPYFGVPSQHVNPVQRYIHYRNAYYNNELDVHFNQFNVWELRQIVNSDATDQELLWGRQSLMAYRPDIITSINDPLWNYCMIVKSDVNYTTPDWYKSPRSYDQILSGGGKCGPRAWYGRFICKAFGIPTWGCKQPGHAAMTRWTTTNNGSWDVCLGGGLWKSWWNDQCGLDFLLETQARSACTSEIDVYYNIYKIPLLSQYYYKEKTNVIRMNAQYDPNSPWCTLGMIMRQLIVQKNTTTTSSSTNATTKMMKLMFPPLNRHIEGNRNQLERQLLTQEKVSMNEGIIQYGYHPSNYNNYRILNISTTTSNNNNTIVIPATTCINPDRNKVYYVNSFLGGQQLFVRDDGTIVYEVDSTQMISLSSSSNNNGVLSYNVSCYVAVAHRSEQPIQLLVNNTDTYTIVMPYTMGLWSISEPTRIIINIDSLRQCSNNNKISLQFQRPKQNFGFAIKYILLEPI